ncbi:uncharacterized protein MONBRDRAFT_10098 [Monosiga brevicollis MX1]|uniref:CDC20/Fizzy WD40 domain-containing protein n=1 Tax=Monosiga brevicollis TaxID=81824 RepID=A9V578_MONBE|nr:uncharacterized protein MONBRDRAFT_10098 [Monosiga brevicollis MX1]EDQ87228.1 predicted protein [Monosiga brevicollis MX1]|eukprot:XP_001747841.1 hypothetical protein [Monosiga brevicollis MX1]
MASYFDNVDSTFGASVDGKTMPRWQRKALDSNSNTGRLQTPKKEAVDRFIPNRASMDIEAAHYKLTHSENVPSPSKEHYAKAIESTLMGEANSKILAFKQKAPQPSEGHKNDLRVLYTQNRGAQRVRKASRAIPQNPERILDAPEMRPDFYLNILDWSSQNQIAVALNNSVYIWDAASGNTFELCHTEQAGDYISSVSWAGDGAHLAVGTSDSLVQIYDVTSQRKVRTMTGHSGRVAAMDWNGHILSTGSASGLIMNSDVRVANHCVSALEGHSQEVCGLKWSPDGKLLASGGNDNLVNIWSANGELRHTLTDHQAAVKALAWCPWQSNLLASGGGTADRHIRFWNTSSGNCVNSIDTQSQVCSLLWSAEHHEIISGHGFSKNQLSIWKYPSLAQVTELTDHTERVLGMAMSPDGQTVASIAADETIRFWKCFAADASNKKQKVMPTSSRLGAMIR